MLSFEPVHDPLMTFCNIAYGLSCLKFTRVLLVKVLLNWSILNMLTFEPLYDTLMAFYYIAFLLSCLKCHTRTFS